MSHTRPIASATALIVALISVATLTGCSPRFWGGPADRATTEHIAANIDSALNAAGAHGTISELTAEYIRVPVGGISVSFSYSETVAGAKVTIPKVHIEVADDSDPHPGDSDVETAIVRSLPYTYQPAYRAMKARYETAVRVAFTEGRLGRLTIDESSFGFLDQADRVSQTRAERKWFDDTAAANRASGDPARQSFFGYYDIDPENVATHTWFNLDFNDNSPTMTAAENSTEAAACSDRDKAIDEDWQLLTTLITSTRPTGFPTTSYAIALSNQDLTSGNVVGESDPFTWNGNGVTPTTALHNRVPSHCGESSATPTP